MNEKISIKRSYIHMCEFLGSLFLVIAALSPMILFVTVLESSMAIAVVANVLA